MNFRVWNLNKSEWIDLSEEGTHFCISGGKFLLFDKFGWAYNQVIHRSTGLKDSSGKEIFEGDIVQHRHRKNSGVVVWRSEEDGWDFTGWMTTGQQLGQGVSGTTVIGNIFENPELISHEDT